MSFIQHILCDFPARNAWKVTFTFQWNNSNFPLFISLILRVYINGVPCNVLYIFWYTLTHHSDTELNVLSKILRRCCFVLGTVLFSRTLFSFGNETEIDTKRISDKRKIIHQFLKCPTFEYSFRKKNVIN